MEALQSLCLHPYAEEAGKSAKISLCSTVEPTNMELGASGL